MHKNTCQGSHIYAKYISVNFFTKCVAQKKKKGFAIMQVLANIPHLSSVFHCINKLACFGLLNFKTIYAFECRPQPLIPLGKFRSMLKQSFFWQFFSTSFVSFSTKSSSFPSSSPFKEGSNFVSDARKIYITEHCTLIS